MEEDKQMWWKQIIIYHTLTDRIVNFKLTKSRIRHTMIVDAVIKYLFQKTSGDSPLQN